MARNVWESITWNAAALPVAAVSALIFSIGLFIWIQNRKSIVNQSFFLICLCVNAWLFSNALMYSARNPDLALSFYRYGTFLGVTFVSPCVYFFSVVWLKLFKKQRTPVLLGFLGAAVFYLLGIFSNWGFRGVHEYPWGYYVRYGPLHYLFILFFFGYFLAAFYNFIYAYRRIAQGIHKTQIKIIAVGFLVSLTGSVDYLPKFFYFPVYPLGFLSVFFWIMTVAYAIVKYRVLDIETVVHRTLFWLATSVVILSPLVGILYAFNRWEGKLTPAGTTAVLAVLFFAFYYFMRTVQPHIDHFFQRGRRDLEHHLMRFNDNLVHLRGLDELLRYIEQTVQNAVYPESVRVYLVQTPGQQFDVPEVFSIGCLGIDAQDPFLQWLNRIDDVVLAEYVDIDPRLEPVREHASKFFDKTGFRICVPLVLSEALIGLIVLGRKSNLKSYKRNEVSFLDEIRPSATIALSNSIRLIQMQENLRRWNQELEKQVAKRTSELEQTQAQLVQAEKLATIGTLAGGVAHEINNPLTAVLTNAQLLKMTAGKDDMESISLIEEGAKRCQIIIQKLLKYARKAADDSAKHKVDLHHVIQSVSSLLAYQFRQENISLVLELDHLIPIEGVANELEQVFTNLLVNARDAIHSAGRKGEIRVRAAQVDQVAEIQVIDNGIGIKKEDLNKIFDPFFTTKAVGKGTGLGLAVTYGILEKHHCQISVMSKEGQGTNFILRFPTSEAMSQPTRQQRAEL